MIGLFFVHPNEKISTSCSGGHTRGKMVVYLNNKGKHIYDFVPGAQLDEGVKDEGKWPRLVDFCG